MSTPTIQAHKQAVQSNTENKETEILVHISESNQKARTESVALHHGHKCLICDFDFVEVYGDFAKGVVHVHHVNPLPKPYDKVDPKGDCAPICANCYSVMHFTKPAMTIEELKSLRAKQEQLAYINRFY